jgi:hypothetical protein
MNPAEALQLAGTIRTMFPAGEASDTLIESYAKLLEAYDVETVAAGIATLMHTNTAGFFPAWAAVEQAIQEANPAEAAWRLIEEHVDADGTSTPSWPDSPSRGAIGRMGGWGIVSGWDGSRTLLRETFLRHYADAQVAEQAAVQDVPQLGAGAKVVNVSADERCTYCGNDGWVELRGTVEDLGMVYPVGVTACRWCELGEIVYTTTTTGKRAKGRKVRPVAIRSDYGEDDLTDRPAPPGMPRLTPAEYIASPAGQRDPALRVAGVREMILGQRSMERV